MLDLAIIGAGPAGLSAAIYAARYLMDFKIYGQIPGGLINEAHMVDNYAGVPNVTGGELVKKFLGHLSHLDIGLEQAQTIKGIRQENGHFVMAFDFDAEEAATVKAKNVLLAIGTERMKLEIPGETEFMGKGVSYCATCDAFFYRNKKVAVVGGSDSAVTSALHLADVANEVLLIYRGKELKARPVWVKRAAQNPKIKLLLETNITQISGASLVEEIALDKEYEGQATVSVDGVFVEIGTIPNIALLKPLGIVTDEKGYIITDEAQRTSIEGIWAAGDITTGSNKLRQIITAASEGAIAVHDIYQTLKQAEQEEAKNE